MPLPVPAAFTWPDWRVVLDNAWCLFMQRPESVLVGSGIIVPITPRETVFDLTPEEWAASYRLLREVKALLDRLHQPDGYNVGWNAGPVAGQTVSHCHCHVIPRFADEPLAGRGIRHALKASTNRRPAG